MTDSRQNFIFKRCRANEGFFEFTIDVYSHLKADTFFEYFARCFKDQRAVITVFGSFKFFFYGGEGKNLEIFSCSDDSDSLKIKKKCSAHLNFFFTEVRAKILKYFLALTIQTVSKLRKIQVNRHFQATLKKNRYASDDRSLAAINSFSCEITD